MSVNTPDVNVVNAAPLLVSEVNKPANQPFQATGSDLITAYETSKNFQLITVPSGKRLGS